MKTLLIILAILSTLPVQAATIIPSDIKNTERSFEFPLATYAYCQSTGAFFVGAAQPVQDNEYALAGCTASADRFFSFAKPRVIVDNVYDQPNPTNGQGLLYLAVAGSFPVLVTQAEPQKIYCYHDFRDLNNIMVSGSEKVLDSNNTISAGIVGLGAGVGNQSKLNFFIAVQNHEGSFGESGSGITPVQIELDDVDIEGKFYNTASIKQGEVLPVTKESSFLGIGQPLQAILNTQNNPVVFHTDAFGSLYTGLSVIGAANEQAGARAVFLGNREIAPASAFQKDSIIGGIGANTQISIHTLKTVFTTTSLHYLLVQGGVGRPEETRNQVFALPLINHAQTGFMYTGMLAKKDSIPVNSFADAEPHHFKSRVFVDPALQPGDLYSSHDREVCVGNQYPLPGEITGLWTVGDTVYITTTGGTEFGGVFYSQALFDKFGRIKGWTNWQRVIAANGAWGGALNGAQSSVIFVQGSTKDTLNQVCKTVWNPSTQHPLQQFAQNFLPAENFGVQGLTDISHNHGALDQGLYERHSMAILSGNKRVALLQTAGDQAGILTPTEQYDLNTTRTFTGEALDQLGAITTSALAYDTTQAWFVVGGNGGVGVLCNEDGTGVPLPVRKNFEQFDDRLRFKKVELGKDVKKIIACNNTLYILTKKQLLRTELSPQALTQKIACTVLAQADELNKSIWLEDVIISGDLALLATSKGLWRVGNGCSCKTALNSDQMGWVSVPLNESPGPVIQLFAVTPTGNEIDVATHDRGGQVYVLSAYMGYHQARIYRLSIEAGPVNESTVQPLPDCFVQNTPTFYINIGDYRNRLFTEGSSVMVARSGNNSTKTDALLQIIPPYELLKNVEKFETNSFHFVTANTRSLIKAAVAQARIRSKKSLGMIQRLSSDGSLVIAADDGLELQY